MEGKVSLLDRIEQGTLIRESWTGIDEQGRETACLLAALVPECGKQKTSAACPDSVMPKWMSRITPSIDDNGSLEKWPDMVRRYANLASCWTILSDAQWLRVQYKFRKECVLEACKTTDDKPVLLSCNQVITFLDSVIESGQIDESARAAAEYAARSAVEAAAEAAAEYAARSAVEAAAEAAARSADDVAAMYVAMAAAEAAAEYAARSAVEAAAWDRLTEKLFEFIEMELQ